MYEIDFAVGDWSSDGHGESETFRVLSSVPVKALREIHFAAKEHFGFDIGDICREYGEFSVPDETVEALRDGGVSLSEMGIDPRSPEAGNLLEIWLAALRRTAQAAGQEIALARKKDEEQVPTIHFFGYDEKGRHLNVPGYGLYT